MKCSNHCRSTILKCIYRWNWEITTFDYRPVTHITIIIIFPTVPTGFCRIYFKKTTSSFIFKFNIIKYKKFIFRAEVCSISNTRVCQIFLSFFGYPSWVFFICRTIFRLNYITCNINCGLIKEWISKSCRCVWHKNHV